MPTRDPTPSPRVLYCVGPRSTSSTTRPLAIARALRQRNPSLQIDFLTSPSIASDLEKDGDQALTRLSPLRSPRTKYPLPPRFHSRQRLVSELLNGAEVLSGTWPVRPRLAILDGLPFAALPLLARGVPSVVLLDPWEHPGSREGSIRLASQRTRDRLDFISLRGARRVVVLGPPDSVPRGRREHLGRLGVFSGYLSPFELPGRQHKRETRSSPQPHLVAAICDSASPPWIHRIALHLAPRLRRIVPEVRIVLAGSDGPRFLLTAENPELHSFPENRPRPTLQEVLQLSHATLLDPSVSLATGCLGLGKKAALVFPPRFPTSTRQNPPSGPESSPIVRRHFAGLDPISAPDLNTVLTKTLAWILAMFEADPTSGETVPAICTPDDFVELLPTDKP